MDMDATHFRKALPKPGFADTASYFERRAGRERNQVERARLSETAEFYRSLERVVPAAPAGFRLNGNGPSNRRVHRWEARAEECRVLAEQFRDPGCRDQLRRLAEDYDKLARQHRGDQRPRS
jgi:hypothetical protein